MRTLLVNVLRRAGYTILEARNGQEALDVYRNYGRPIDLLVTDIVLPVMSGPELAEQLARCQPNLKVLYVSGYAEGQDRILIHRGSHTGVAFLEKPFTIAALTQKIRETLESR